VYILAKEEFWVDMSDCLCISLVLVFLCPRLHIQVLGRERLLLSLLPPPAQPSSGGALPEGFEEIYNKKDWL